MQLAPARPPFIEFKRIAKHDPVASQEAGYRKTKDIDYAFVMQPGSKDQVERVATDWLKMLRQKLLDGAPDAYPQEWIDQINKKYEMWKEGQEAPLNGTSVKEWPLLSPAQAENFIALRILTIEDVAAMTEDALQHFGMGARELRDKAREWLTGKEVATNTIAALEERIKELEAKLSEASEPVEPVRRGRKPKE